MRHGDLLLLLEFEREREGLRDQFELANLKGDKQKSEQKEAIKKEKAG